MRACAVALVLFAAGCSIDFDRFVDPADASAPDAGSDATQPDAGTKDAPSDAGQPDAGDLDASGPDGGHDACVPRLAPSNLPSDLTIPDDLGALLVEPTLAPTVTLHFNTDTGQIDRWDGWTRSDFRAAGSGVTEGIFFTRVDQETDGAPPLGIFAIQALHLEPFATIAADGAPALVLLVFGDAEIHGSIDVGARATDVPGPASGRGGSDTVGVNGSGPGGGQGGTSLNRGGGGGGFATVGGAGGAVTGGPSGGDPYASPELVPLLGGSGGGRGHGTLGGDGGNGGGALQLSVYGVLTISGHITANGRGGWGGGAADGEIGGGGGGGSGGAILLEAPTILLTTAGRIWAPGGGGGQGGVCASASNCDPGQNGSSSLLEAPPSEGGGEGENRAGGRGSDSAGIAEPGDPAVSGGTGGGGGGAGRIRINNSDESTAFAGQIFPALGSPAASVGTTGITCDAPP